MMAINLVDTAPARPTTNTVEVYDPALCCASGVCGPGVDPSLLQIASDLHWLEAQGIPVARFNLAQQPAAFVANQRITGLLQAFGEQALPATVVNGTIVAHGRYPSRDEVLAALDHAPAASPSATDAPCTPGAGCC